ncbi:MAG: glycosyltransferase, partial [Fulvivirga sp.]|nr:glycosyltransferase [Fulvivirga sp.]
QKKLLLSNYFQNTIFYVTAHAPGFLYQDYNQAPMYEIPMYWTGEMEKSVLKSADFVISPSAFLIDEISKYIDWDQQAKKVIHNPYKTDLQPVEGYVPYDIVFFGKLTPQKGCLELLTYFKNLWDQGFEHPLKLIGGGNHYFYPRMMDMEAYFRKKYSKYIKEKLLIFEGHISPKNLPERLAKAHVVLVPSIVDNLPYTVLEAMSMGKVVLGSKNGGHAEIIEHEKSGFLFEHDSKGKSFETTLDHILKLPGENISEIGSHAHKRVAELCNYETIYQQKMELLLQKDKNATPKNHFPFTYEIQATPDNKVPDSQHSSQLLSVVVPYYNMGAYLNQAIKSIQQSDYSPLEIIIVDDGSDDPESIRALEKWRSEENIHIISKANEGLSITRNVGAKEAKGAFLAFLDPDDEVTSTYYSKAIDILKRYKNVSFVGCWASYFDQSDISWPSFNPEPPYLLVHNMINSSALVYKRDDFLKTGLNDPAMLYGMEDYDSVINMVKNGMRGVAIPEKLWKYRIRSGSMAQSFNEFSKNYLYRLISKKHQGFYAQFASEIANLLNANGPGYFIENPTRLTRKPLPFISPKMISFIKRNKILRNIAKIIYRRIRH